jgi:hypothetical protein
MFSYRVRASIGVAAGELTTTRGFIGQVLGLGNHASRGLELSSARQAKPAKRRIAEPPVARLSASATASSSASAPNSIPLVSAELSYIERGHDLAALDHFIAE